MNGNNKAPLHQTQYPGYGQGNAYPGQPAPPQQYPQPGYQQPQGYQQSFQQQQQYQQGPNQYPPNPGYNQNQAPYPPANDGFQKPPLPQGNVQGFPNPGTGGIQPSAPALPEQYSGEVPTDDLDENAVTSDNFQAPPPTYDVVINGYENATGPNEAPVGPPPAYENVEADPALVDPKTAKQLTDEDARQALLLYVSQQTCWGKGAAESMDMKDIQSTSAYHYILESFTEGRSTKYTQVPYKGEYVDSAHNGPAPLPWEIASTPTAPFKNETQLIEVPHTATVKVCNRCFGMGFNRCWKCHGRGNVRCSFCHGSGSRSHHDADGNHRTSSCSSCHGRGRKRCITCHGRGCLICSECQGYRQVRQFIQLTVKYENKVSEHVVERTDLPDDLIKNVQGDTIFTQTALRVRSIEQFTDNEINQKSNELVRSHSIAWPSNRILQQRHTLRSVPVYECVFKHGSKEGRFWVYGHQHEIYTKDYPHTCCCCSCTIL